MSQKNNFQSLVYIVAVAYVCFSLSLQGVETVVVPSFGCTPTLYPLPYDLQEEHTTKILDVNYDKKADTALMAAMVKGAHCAPYLLFYDLKNSTITNKNYIKLGQPHEKFCGSFSERGKYFTLGLQNSLFKNNEFIVFSRNSQLSDLCVSDILGDPNILGIIVGYSAEAFETYKLSKQLSYTAPSRKSNGGGVEAFTELVSPVINRSTSLDQPKELEFSIGYKCLELKKIRNIHTMFGYNSLLTIIKGYCLNTLVFNKIFFGNIESVAYLPGRNETGKIACFPAIPKKNYASATLINYNANEQEDLFTINIMCWNNDQSMAHVYNNCVLSANKQFMAYTSKFSGPWLAWNRINNSIIEIQEEDIERRISTHNVIIAFGNDGCSYLTDNLFYVDQPDYPYIINDVGSDDMWVKSCRNITSYNLYRMAYYGGIKMFDDDQRKMPYRTGLLFEYKLFINLIPEYAHELERGTQNIPSNVAPSRVLMSGPLMIMLNSLFKIEKRFPRGYSFVGSEENTPVKIVPCFTIPKDGTIYSYSERSLPFQKPLTNMAVLNKSIPVSETIKPNRKTSNSDFPWLLLKPLTNMAVLPKLVPVNKAIESKKKKSKNYRNKKNRGMVPQIILGMGLLYTYYSLFNIMLKLKKRNIGFMVENSSCARFNMPTERKFLGYAQQRIWRQ